MNRTFSLTKYPLSFRFIRCDILSLDVLSYRCTCLSRLYIVHLDGDRHVTLYRPRP